MSLDSVIARARQRKKQLSRSTCTIRRPSERTFDAETGNYIDSVGELVYSDWCIVKPAGREGDDIAAGEAESRVNDYTVEIEANTPALINDVVSFPSSADAGLLDKTMRVSDVPLDEQQVNRVLVCEDVS